MKTEYKIAKASETELALQLAIELATKAIITKDNPIDNSIASCRADDVKQLIRKTTKHLSLYKRNDLYFLFSPSS